MNQALTVVKNYAEQRNNLIDNIVFLTKQVYPKDKEMLDCVMDLTTDLMISDPSQEFIDGMRGFLLYAGMGDIKPSTALTTLIHDLGEFSRNRFEPWFAPRTARYNKYLTGASEATI